MSAESERLEAEEVSSAERPFIPDSLPVLPLRDTVLFPNSFMPLAVAREGVVRLIDEVDRPAAGRSRSSRSATPPLEEPTRNRPLRRWGRPPTSTRCSSCRTAAFA